MTLVNWNKLCSKPKSNNCDVNFILSHVRMNLKWCSYDLFFSDAHLLRKERPSEANVSWLSAIGCQKQTAPASSLFLGISSIAYEDVFNQNETDRLNQVYEYVLKNFRRKILF